jgi:hypothetical protein
MAVNTQSRNTSLAESSGATTSTRTPKAPLHLSCEACSSCFSAASASACGECTEKGSVRPTPGLYRACGGNASGGYTLCEVRRHCTAESAWLVAGDDIYDATEYLKSDQHPGGQVSILKKAGGAVDCTEDFRFHSRGGRKMWQKYHVGKLVPCKELEYRQWWMFWA